jgi:hypothetical protein
MTCLRAFSQKKKKKKTLWPKSLYGTTFHSDFATKGLMLSDGFSLFLRHCTSVYYLDSFGHHLRLQFLVQEWTVLYMIWSCCWEFKQKEHIPSFSARTIKWWDNNPIIMYLELYTTSLLSIKSKWNNAKLNF